MNRLMWVAVSVLAVLFVFGCARLGDLAGKHLAAMEVSV